MAVRRCSGPGITIFWVARPLEVPGSRPLALESDAQGSLGARAGGMAGRSCRQMPVFLPSGRSRAVAAAAGSHAQACCSGLPAGRPGIAGGDHRLETRARRDRHRGANPDPALRHRHPPGLVEAGGAARCGGLGRDCGRYRARGSLVPGRAVVGLDAPESQLEAAFALAKASPVVQGLRGGADDFRRACPQLACRRAG